MADECDAEFAGGSLSADAPRPADRFDGRRDAQVEEKPSTVRTPEKLAEAAELSEQMQHGLAQLSPELREAVILRDLQGLDYDEIQTVMQVPEGTVKSRINRGRIEMATNFEGNGWVEDEA